MTNSKTIRLGVIGLHNHYHIYPMAGFVAAGLDGLQIVGVYDERAALAEEFAKLYNIPNVHASSEELLSRSDLDAVLIMSFTASHHSDVLAAVRHGKHILLDKPISINTGEAAEMVNVMTARPKRPSMTTLAEHGKSTQFLFRFVRSN